MPALSGIGDVLKLLPPSVRRTIYIVVTLFGVALAVCQAAGVSAFGSVSMAEALKVYAYLSPVAGVVAVANVSKAHQPDDDTYAAYDDDADLSSFEPVGASSDVYAPFSM